MALFNFLTFYGRFGFALCLCLALYGIGRLCDRPRLVQLARRLALAGLLSGLLVSLGKPLIGRREYFTSGRDKVSENWLSRRWGRLPSGDSALAWSISTAAALEFPLLAGPAYILATLTALGRVFRDAHLLADAVAGSGVGYYCACLVTAADRRALLHHRHWLKPRLRSGWRPGRPHLPRR